MRIIPITEYNEQTMQLAKAVYDSRGRVLLAANHTVHPIYLERFVQMGISHLVIEDSESKGITLEEMLDFPTWLELIVHVKLAYAAAAEHKPFPTKPLFQGAKSLADEVKRRPVAISVPVTAMAAELHNYAHAVNVALISLQIAKSLSYNDLQLRDLAVGCLLHDIGKGLCDGRDGHPEAGFNFLRSIREVSLPSAHVAFQHHEQYDGSGFPRKISGAEIHEYAQICGLANFYENLVSVLHVAPHEAVEAVLAQNGSGFDPRIVQSFVQGGAPYPPGSKVVLSNGERAIVTRIDSNMQRPAVRFSTTGQEVSLSEHPSLMIARHLDS
ncbi:HD-GYP domain-containing protein [uncultured Paenibacillus sp.]|uniref:HD-GYP domain-containing protein n=1 Tax=uncultured Paenibacillus sp. TaxID=227322 RepID=UPI0015AECAEA|nr:HD domain-containing phosphohydrolase [uncultured Paenibacillus sp.]